MHKLCVIIPCYNYQNFVGEAIESVVSQNCPECDLIVIDDQSTDKSWEVIQSWGVRAYRVPNGGGRRAFVAGLEHTTAPFILCLDADDKLKPGSLAKIIQRLDQDVAKLQYSLTKIDARGASFGEAHPNLWNYRLRDRLIKEVARTGVYRCPPTSGNVFRRDVCELVKEAEYDRAVDGVALFAAPFYGDVVSLSEQLGCYRIHGENISGMGGLLKPEVLKHEVDRFMLRMRHLQAIIRARGYDGITLAPDRAYFYLERSLYYAIVRGERPTFRHLRLLVGALIVERMSLGTKLKLLALFVCLKFCSETFALKLIQFRMGTGRRTTAEFFRMILS
ncbi:glycosyltransferase family 2 protein [Methylobacterium sp. J-076]|uniref:glycosyltransferase family 2 protein n=1 Tax=Methylobacterium sp. J-076 TaxID=2836655 RepID=UPI001FB9DA94|nr:glycosyltransferase family 2 protein [Methylobacterium sp. J-076]MCJ2012614.1 glycosyltransferase [Methylobacterium sp. J-076]